MCKVMMIAGIKDSTRANAIKFMKAMAIPMSVSNSDGLGYAAVTKDNKLFAERWLVNKDAFVSNAKDVELMSKYQHIATGTAVVSDYTSTGVVDLDNVVALTLHTRMATSAKGMENTHPFIKDGVSVIHNGVIDNTYDFKLEQSSCDSETILLQYLKTSIASTPDNMDEFAAGLKGYYACGVFSPGVSGYQLDLFKGNNHSLGFAYVDELETLVFATSVYDIENVCKQLGFKMRQSMTMKEGMLVRLDAATGEIVLTKSFNVRSRYEQTNVYNSGDYKEFWTNKKQNKVLPETKSIPKHVIDYMKSGMGSMREIIYE